MGCSALSVARTKNYLSRSHAAEETPPHIDYTMDENDKQAEAQAKLNADTPTPSNEESRPLVASPTHLGPCGVQIRRKRW